VAKVNLNLADDMLVILGKRGIKTREGYQGPLSLSLEELKAIQNYFNSLKRSPTDIEVETPFPYTHITLPTNSRG